MECSGVSTLSKLSKETVSLPVIDPFLSRDGNIQSSLKVL